MSTASGTPLLMAIDGNSLLHRAHHAHEHSGQRDLGGRPTWGLRGMVAAIGGAAARLGPDAVIVGFDCAIASRRREEYPEYKAGRAEKADELVDQLTGAAELLRACGFAVVQHEGWEADDVLSSAAALARDRSWRCTVVTSDRDSFALIDQTTSVLRIIAGGVDASPLLTPARLPLLCGVQAGQYRDYAAIRGDVSDNLPGVNGIGAKTAAKLLTAFWSVADVYAALDGGRVDEVVAVVGPAAARRLVDPVARTNVARNLHLMSMRQDLPMPSLEAMRVPMDLVRLQAGLLERDIRLGPSLWALTGSPPPGQDTWARIAEQEDLPAAPAAEVPAAPVPVASVAEDDQLSLF
ncbi:5'-3' exonuclease [Angustibacter sp. McL0619]|uniref:5'-3' exonuclease n=1 Tax=Angustibacter sp. McL0619 TaxID=3415676 RepID=UPI003CF40F3C